MDLEKFTWPLSKRLLYLILQDNVSDNFVIQLIWERLYYKEQQNNSSIWIATRKTPTYWSKDFPESPQLISQRKASVHLTRSIPKEYKQLIKKRLFFKGYKINELYPRLTRRATAINWLLAWSELSGNPIPEEGLIPTPKEKPSNPINGHPNDPPIV